MIGKRTLCGSGVALLAVCAVAAGPQAVSAQTYSRCGSYAQPVTYSQPVTYVSYQPTQYAPVYTDRQVVYTAPVQPRYTRYVQPAPVREVVQYVEPVRTHTVYVKPSYNHGPRVSVYASYGRGSHRGYGYGYGYSSYRSGHHRSSYRPYRYSRHGYRSVRGFHVDAGRLHVSGRRGHHGGFSVRLRR